MTVTAFVFGAIAFATLLGLCLVRINKAPAPRSAMSITSIATAHGEQMYIEQITDGATTSQARSAVRAMLHNQYAMRADVLTMVLRTAIAQANRTLYPNEYEEQVIDMVGA
jgi:hypothetical protein